uniref:Uncharacterized protein n=1 Tax=Photinus pyralis TaxID=7054 RepID=A0A1Y1LLH4_PHOPY
MHRLMILILLVQLSSIEVFSEDAYDEDPLTFLESHISKYRPYKTFHDKDRGFPDFNYLRYSRGRSESILPFMDDLESEYDDEEQFARPTRSQDKNDNFVRFGRGNSDFIRFGRDPYKYGREMRANDQNFLRFGRNAPENDTEKKRSKRSVDVQDKRGSDSFLRFGKAGDDSFIRYGRNQQKTKLNLEEEFPMPTVSRPLPPSFELEGTLRFPLVLNDRILHKFPLLTILKKLEEVRQNH